MAQTVDWRTLENQLKTASGTDYCTYQHIHSVTGFSRYQLGTRAKRVAVIQSCPKLYPCRAMAQAIAGWKKGER